MARHGERWFVPARQPWRALLMVPLVIAALPAAAMFGAVCGAYVWVRDLLNEMPEALR